MGSEPRVAVPPLTGAAPEFSTFSIFVSWEGTLAGASLPFNAQAVLIIGTSRGTLTRGPVSRGLGRQTLLYQCTSQCWKCLVLSTLTLALKSHWQWNAVHDARPASIACMRHQDQVLQTNKHCSHMMMSLPSQATPACIHTYFIPCPSICIWGPELPPLPPSLPPPPSDPAMGFC